MSSNGEHDQQIENTISPDGVIQQSIPISSSVTSDTEITLQIDVEDSAGHLMTGGSKKFMLVAK